MRNENTSQSTVTDDWFWNWVDRHMARFPRGDWPPLEAEYWKAMRHMLVTRGVTETVAESASMLMFGEPSVFPDDHPDTLLIKIRQVWRESEVKTTSPVAPRDVAGNAEWDRAAEANWAQLSTEDREDALAMVRANAGPFGRHPGTLLKLAKGWAYDPMLAMGPPPAPVQAPKQSGPQRVFVEHAEQRPVETAA